jgi:hypothetical protein
MPGCLLGSRVLMWRVAGMILRAAFASFGVAWPLFLPRWGLMWTDKPTFYTILWSAVGRCGAVLPDKRCPVLSCHAIVVGGAFSEGVKPPGLDIYLKDRILHRETRLYQGVLIHRQIYHGDYAYSFSRVAMSGDDGMSFST